MRRVGTLAVAATAMLVVGACGSSKNGGGTSSSGAQGPGPLSAEAKSAATGDIPDSQVFLLFRDPQAGYLIR